LSKKGDRSVGFGGGDDKIDKGKNTPKVTEIAPEVVVDLENVHFNDKASDIRYAREKIFGKIVQKSPDDASQKSRKKKKIGKDAMGRTMSIGGASMNDSAV
jgi:hypothetical protein